eukprot:tig00001025_g6357.t2
MPRRAARRGAAAAIASRLGLTSCDALDGRGVAEGPPGHFCNLRSRGVGGGETGGALRTGGGFASGPGRVVPARAEARRAARGGPAAASLRVRVRRAAPARAEARRAARCNPATASRRGQDYRHGLRRGGRRTGARRRLVFRSRSSDAIWGEAGGTRGLGGGFTSGPGPSSDASWGEAGGARGLGGGFTSGPGLAARAGARRAARGGSAAASLPAQRRELGRGGRRAGARWRLHFRPRSSGASWGEAGGARGLGGGFTSGPSPSSDASWGEAGGARGLGGGFTSGPGLAARAGARRAARGARWRLHFRPRSSGASWGEAGGARGLGGGFTSGPGPSSDASWGEAGGALGHGGGFTSGPGLAARAGARRAAREGSAAASSQVRRRELGRGGRRAGARRRLHFRPRSSGASWGEAGGARGLGGGFTSGPGLAARAGARRAAHGGTAAASLPAQRRELGRSGRRAGARRRLHFRPKSSDASWGEAGGARGLGGGFTSGPGLAARAGAKRAARGGSVAASLPAQRRKLGRGGRRARARRRLHFRPRSSGASWGEAGGARGLGDGFTSGPGLAARAGARRVAHGGTVAASLPAQRRELGRGGWRTGARRRLHFRPRSSGASWGEAGRARGLGGGFTSGSGRMAQWEARRAGGWGPAAYVACEA